MPKELDQFVSDYKYILIDVPRLPEQKRSRLTSDFKVIADFFAEKDRKNYKPSRQTIVHVEAVLHMLQALTKDKRYEMIEEDIIKSMEKGEPISMCEFAEKMEQTGIRKGVRTGMRTGVKKGIDSFAELTRHLIADSRIEDLKKAAEDEGFRKTLYKEYNIQLDLEESESI